MKKRLTFPAPHRECFTTQTGFVSRPWTMEGVLTVIAGGGWFQERHHEFADASIAEAAGLLSREAS